jgi:HEAT repeat protein
MRAAKAKPRPWEEELAALNALDPAAERGAQNEAISLALASKHYRVVTRAATLAGERVLHERIPDLLAAWPRFLHDPVKQDPHCLAKAAITGALLALEFDDSTFWLAGMRYRQNEPVWGGSTDTAVDVRCNCALGLAGSGHGRAIAELTALLNDPERRVRAGAARAISCGNPLEAEPLLRFKILVGDADAEVLGECFTALLAIAPEESMALVAQRLRDSDESVRDYAALALGESRYPAALEQLKGAWNGVLVSPELRATLARAAALHRSDAAFDWLISIVETGSERDSGCAADALAVYGRNIKLMERVNLALAARTKR